jgi:hypothetical protein
MCGIEIPVLGALVVTEVSQQQYTWIGKRFYDLPSHYLLPEFAARVDADRTLRVHKLKTATTELSMTFVN